MSLKPKTRKAKKRKSSTMFYDPPASSELAQIITIRSPREATVAIKTLIEMHNRAPRHEMIHIEQAATLASNRAAAFIHSPEISPKEKKQMKSVSKKYRTAAIKMRKTRTKYENGVM